MEEQTFAQSGRLKIDDLRVEQRRTSNRKMRYGTETRLSTSQVLAKAEEYFGPDGLGLEVSSRDNCCISLSGGGGHVTVTVTEGDNTSLDVETREWDHQVKKFLTEKLK
jgi:hypothetical protein